MKQYRVNEIFYSIQGEGFHAGTPAIFIRFSGCNLNCPFCDTDFKEYTLMTEDEILDKVVEVSNGQCYFIVLTGGEPTMQIDESLLNKLDDFYIAMESNGTYRTQVSAKCQDRIDWVTISPKSLYTKCELRTYDCDELKYVLDDVVDENKIIEQAENIHCKHFYIQPCDTGDKERNQKIIERCVNFVKNNPEWKLSLQLQKILNVR